MRLLVRTLEFVRFAPKGTAKITEELVIAGDGLVLGGRKHLHANVLDGWEKARSIIFNISTTENIMRRSSAYGECESP